MDRNIEIKARIHDLAAIAEKAQRLAGSEPTLLVQEDVFFATPTGRLKLRTFGDGRAELIYYDRENLPGPKMSNYVRLPVEQPLILLEMLQVTNGIIGIVRKRRSLFSVGRTRIHVDEVEGLGDFLELEVVLAPGESADAAVEVAHQLLRELGVSPSDLVEGAYVDLAETRAEG